VVVAEGVESEEQLGILWQLGCDQSQGYLHSKPLPAQRFAALLESAPAHPAQAGDATGYAEAN
jgi:EAL domain-containing protein (putative c-di-GMP-specific phosphodiesterase class I)